MVGIYFCGTGNTKHCTDLFVREIGEIAKCGAKIIRGKLI